LLAAKLFSHKEAPKAQTAALIFELFVLSCGALLPQFHLKPEEY
jgi:hypothetical protein